MALAETFEISQLAIPSVSVLIGFLAYTSQYFFYCFEAAPLRKDEIWKINIFAVCIWICYYRACFVDPGRLPQERRSAKTDEQEKDKASARQRWCRRCEAFKPPRAHHCKTCKRSEVCNKHIFSQANFNPDVFPRWITIVRGPQIVSHISRTRILFDFCSTQ